MSCRKDFLRLEVPDMTCRGHDSVDYGNSINNLFLK